MATTNETTSANTGTTRQPQPARVRWRQWLGRTTSQTESTEDEKAYRPKATMGILMDKIENEVPGKLFRPFSAESILPAGLVADDFYRNGSFAVFQSKRAPWSKPPTGTFVSDLYPVAVSAISVVFAHYCPYEENRRWSDRAGPST